MISIELAPSQFDEALKLLADSDDAKVEAASETDSSNPNKHGHVHTSQIDADYEYQQRGNTGTLVFTNEVKHGMTKFASDETIGAHLASIVAHLPVVDEPEQDETVPEKPTIATTNGTVKPNVPTETEVK